MPPGKCHPLFQKGHLSMYINYQTDYSVSNNKFYIQLWEKYGSYKKKKIQVILEVFLYRLDKLPLKTNLFEVLRIFGLI